MHDKIISDLCEKFGKNPKDIAKNKHGKISKLTYEDVLNRILEGGGSPISEIFPEMSRVTITTMLQRCFPGKDRDKVHWSSYLLSILELKRCSKCSNIRKYSDFTKNSTTGSGFCTSCIFCAKEYRIANKESLNAYSRQYNINNKEVCQANGAKRRAVKLRAVPNWANLEEITLIYLYRPEGHHVDHIIPLQGELVCGLHCEHNLQYLPANENIAKSNKFNIEDYVHIVEYTPPYL